MKIAVLRLDHRHFRDQRMTTHVALTARALGADILYYSGDKDENLETTVNDVVKRWGGEFVIEHVDRILELFKKWSGTKVHLTMYGEKHRLTIDDLKHHGGEDLLIIVGGAKVPRYVYTNVDFNTSIGWQPHSEVAALAIFLNNLLGDEYLYTKYSDSEMTIPEGNRKSIRSERFKKIEDT
ncbi:MAG: tRNA (cytidine(56)-2'-O)-methyltransferase [Candidatus Heimdallarchaeota archaeon]